MKGVELYGQVRRAVYVEGMSRREAARRLVTSTTGPLHLGITEQGPCRKRNPANEIAGPQPASLSTNRPANPGQRFVYTPFYYYFLDGSRRAELSTNVSSEAT